MGKKKWFFRSVNFEKTTVVHSLLDRFEIRYAHSKERKIYFYKRFRTCSACMDVPGQNPARKWSNRILKIDVTFFGQKNVFLKEYSSHNFARIWLKLVTDVLQGETKNLSWAFFEFRSRKKVLGGQTQKTTKNRNFSTLRFFISKTKRKMGNLKSRALSPNAGLQVVFFSRACDDWLWEFCHATHFFSSNFRAQVFY